MVTFVESMASLQSIIITFSLCLLSQYKALLSHMNSEWCFYRTLFSQFLGFQVQMLSTILPFDGSWSHCEAVFSHLRVRDPIVKALLFQLECPLCNNHVLLSHLERQWSYKTLFSNVQGPWCNFCHILRVNGPITKLHYHIRRVYGPITNHYSHTKAMHACHDCTI